ncbi:uncharacterized protein LOC110029252 isoform X2 [Phalaenopsis equestris]|uniref:uncharacterized protein LOC110029252 isoform X2 n=1 Tax=Phalaenopsis equestris TaxID=78828 RepID=UPI0009E3C744|nr:uncharacterized protein LOC110029252 isoform X2 [Phalaenopsis equestris]
MEEFKEKDDEVSQAKHEGDEHYEEKVGNNFPIYHNDFNLLDEKAGILFVQGKNFMLGSDNHPPKTEPSIRTKQIYNKDVDREPHSLDISEEFSRNYKRSSASTYRPTKVAFSMDFARNKDRKLESHHRYLGGKLSSSINGVSKINKGKEPIVYESEDESRSSSNRRDVGCENNECISSRGIVSTIKRARLHDSESEKLAAGKRLKGSKNGNFSFMNWMSSITNGLSRPQDRHMEPPFSFSEERRESIGVSHGSRGFRSIFHAVYHPGNSALSDKIKNFDCQKEMDTSKGAEEAKASNVSCCVLPERLNFGDDEKENNSAIVETLVGIDPRANDIEIHDKVLASSNRYIKDNCQVKGSPSAAMDCHAELTANRGQAFHDSLWIPRLSQGVSSPQFKPIKFSNCLDLSAKKLTISPKYCKRLKPTNSSFSQRFDASNLMKSSEICIFCGMNDHITRECSEVVETKLELYLKSFSVYGSINRESCLCILCFQLDHWAASCPNPSSEGSHISFMANCFSDVKFKSTAKHKHVNPSIMFRSEDKMFLHQVLNGSTLSQKENETIETDIVVGEEVRSEKNEVAGCGSIDLHIFRREDSINMNKMKLSSSRPSENGLKKSEFKTFCSRLPTTIIDKPEAFFVAVRKLRLSRLDVLRWMKSRAPHYNLGGFFLRLRIGKLEKGLESTRYHVARINAESCQSSISVCVGSSTYLITRPFISNHDFNEDELMAWWFQSSRDGTKMPTAEELNDKFQLRLRFGF